MSRRRATDPGNRIGVLFVNPGGPGGPTFDLVQAVGLLLTPEVLARYDIVGVDPRGTERSSPIRCDSSPTPFSAESPTSRPATQADRVRASYAALGRSCELSAGKMIGFLDTPTAAADLDTVRVALGEERISFLGLSYGTYLGAMYQSRYPSHSARMVLDSALTPTRFGTNLFIDRAAANEVALDAFLDACSNGTLNPCGFNDGTDLRARYLKVRSEVTAGSANGSRAFDAQVGQLVGYPRDGWPILGRALQEVATRGRGNFAATAADIIPRDNRERITPQDTFSQLTNLAINCRDGIIPSDPGAFDEIARQIPVVAPRFSTLAPSIALASLTCAGWPAATLTVPVFAPTGVPTLVIANRFDLTTPMVWSKALATELGAVLLTREGGGHVALDKSACVRDAAAHFLLDSAPSVGSSGCAS